jgi:hypothetical protein
LISRNYYYFVATLSHINYGDKPPVSSKEFREQCEQFLHKSDAALIDYCIYDPKLSIETVAPTGSAFIDLVILRERILNLTLANLRAAKLKRPALEEPPASMPRTKTEATTAFEMDDPLEAMLFIDRGRWGFLNEIFDEVVGGNYFSVNSVFAYLLKLQLLERKQIFDVKKGTDVYHELYNTILRNFNNMEKEDK